MRADNKAVILGEKINVHNMRPFAEGGDNDGDAGEPEPGRDVTFSGMTLTKKQFEELVGEGAFESFFNQTKNAPLEPAFTSFKKIKLDGKYRNCSAKFVLGHTNAKEIEVNGATLKGLALTFPKVCNERACAELAGTVQGIFPRSTATLEMENFAGKEVRLSIRLGSAEETQDEDDKQQDLVKRAKEAEEMDATRKPAGEQPRVN
jgi:hypothetical protein